MVTGRHLQAFVRDSFCSEKRRIFGIVEPTILLVLYMKSIYSLYSVMCNLVQQRSTFTLDYLPSFCEVLFSRSGRFGYRHGRDAHCSTPSFVIVPVRTDDGRAYIRKATRGYYQVEIRPTMPYYVLCAVSGVVEPFYYRKQQCNTLILCNPPPGWSSG